VLAATLALAGCGDLATAPRATPDPEPVAAAYPGFDIAVLPGDAALRAWRGAAPYAWIGYYLVAPCHRDASFTGRRAALAAAGYGTAVLYVGQQTWEGVASAAPADAPVIDGGLLRAERRVAPPVPAAAARTARLYAHAGTAVTCSRTLLSAAQGAAEGADAAARTAADAFPRGTTIFLDLEPMRVIPEVMRSYYRAWARAVVTDGRYRPGVYVHHTNAAAVYADLRAVAAETGAGEVPVWVARSAGFTLARRPEDSGFAFARVWQGALDVARTWGGVTLVVDENVASRASPSAP
jgi:hypothetical protein